ncbi:hypothetical protein PR048_020593 [Dryococelus australis]|uniref:Uncharacterized protein n=1 Tax=Dryococelus australis TaxID=614101 RepID=A0ABQ9H6T9_9NEOP|nr:hypothetical protein PR048_020593 [Dryococelus australis]
MRPLQVLQSKALKRAVGVPRYMPSAPLHAELKYPHLRENIKHFAEQFYRSAATNTNRLANHDLGQLRPQGALEIHEAETPPA